MPANVIDMTVFVKLQESLGADFVGELMDTFFGDSPRLLEQLRRALTGHDSGTFRRAAHTLKSNAATFGAAHLTELARELESMAREDKLDGAAERIEPLAREYEKVRAALEALKSGS